MPADLRIVSWTRFWSTCGPESRFEVVVWSTNSRTVALVAVELTTPPATTLALTTACVWVASWATALLVVAW